MSKRLLIVSHAPSANTAALTEAVLCGARHADVAGVEARCLRPFEAQPADILSADGLVLGTTENFGYMSGALKDFFDRIYYPCLEHTAGLPYAVFVRAGNDGEGARTSIERIVAGLRWNAVQPAAIFRGEFSPDFLAHAEQLGLAMSAGLEAGVF